MTTPTSKEMEDALVCLVASGPQINVATAELISAQAAASRLVSGFIDHHHNCAAAAFADGVLLGLQIAETRSEKP
jgi:hypothetical protein